MTRFTYLFISSLISIALTQNYVTSSPQNGNTPSLDTTRTSLSSTILTIHGGSNTTTPKPDSQRKQTKSTVTFLYELHEHEIYSPATSTWTERRFTQSPLTGGGGRDSTSLDPASCTPPRNYLWDGEWKIDMTGDKRDGFGWEYYVGRFDGLGRRRRRWVRSLRRVGGGTGRRSGGVERSRNVTRDEVEEKKISPTLLRAIIDQYSFKGFGWSFTKSLIWKRSFGATFRVPLSSNFEFLDRYAAIPFASWTTYFGYPWVVATFLNASVPLEVIEWIIGGILWKIKWSLAVVSALVRSVTEAAIWIFMTPWRTWMAFQHLMSRRGKSGMAQSLMNSMDADEKDEDNDKTIKPENEDNDLKIDGLIEMSTASSANKEIGDMSPISTSAVVGSPRGGASTLAPRTKRFLTMFGHPVPTFHRTTNIEYSNTISRRIGICISWRVSQERGYEYRWNFFYTFLPTQECWEHLDKVATRKIEALKRLASKKLVESNGSQTSIIKSFLYAHSATLGLSSGFPIPVDPFFSLSLLLSTSGFYYGWLLKYMLSVLRLSNSVQKNNELLTSGEEKVKETNETLTSAETINESGRIKEKAC